MKKDSFGCKEKLKAGKKEYTFYSLKKAQEKLGDFTKLPNSLKVLLENLLRNEDGNVVTETDIKNLVKWQTTRKSTDEINFHPARVVMQDFTGVPAVVDLAAMRDAMLKLGGNPEKINPLVPVDLVIDHSVQVDKYGTPSAFKENMELEFSRNQERYEFLKWGQMAFKNFRVVPPGTGIVHQVNLEYLGKTVWTNEQNEAYFDTCVGTDSHTTMINGISVLGWGVGGIEAEAAMLGQAVTMTIPEVIGFKLSGQLPEGTTSTDLVLTVTKMLRSKGVVDKFVEFYGPGLAKLSLADRATISNMAPEYGATCGFFPTDQETINFLKFTGRDPEVVELVEAYAKAQGVWWTPQSPDPVFTDSLELDMGTIVPCLAGPKRPQDRVALTQVAASFETELKNTFASAGTSRGAVAGRDFEVKDGDIFIAAITSCTNTSNPAVLIAAGLLAKKANALGLKSKPWVKTSLAPGSQVVTDYLSRAGLLKDLESLGFNLVGYGCTTCIGNSGPINAEISKSILDSKIVSVSVLSGNRNFEGRIAPEIKANYLASPPLVVAYAIAGNIRLDITKDPLGKDSKGADVYLKDIWPSNQEIQLAMRESLTPEMFKQRYSNVFEGTKEWQNVKAVKKQTYTWDSKSTYVQNPPYFVGMGMKLGQLKDIKQARPLAILGDSVTTDHISPAGNIKADSPAGKFLQTNGVQPVDFNQYGARRGNHEVMMRGTFANIRLKNEMVGGIEGGFTKKMPAATQTTIFDASRKYQDEGTPLVIIAGKEYGTGSSRDWAAKGTTLLGVKAVIAESFERIHRSNLIGMGVIPLEFPKGTNRTTLHLTGDETFSITGITSLHPRAKVQLTVHKKDGSESGVELISRIDTANELEYYKNGGILHYVLRNLAK